MTKEERERPRSVKEEVSSSSQGTMVSGRRSSSWPPPPHPGDYDDVTPLPRSSLVPEQVGPPPPSSAGSVRLSLTGSGRNLRGVRVGLVDTDPTRTDALAVALRARQAEVQVTALRADRAHMRLLRKFAPHAVLIDEEVLSSVGRPFVDKLREDPFLGHTQLFPLRFERLYRPRYGVASIETVREILEPLGRAESELLARLGPHVEVEFELDQFPPHRLLRMLAGRPAPTTIQCTREKEMLRWTVVGGKTGHAELYALGVDEPERLSADEALDWLLRHNNCQVVLSQPTEFDDKTGREVIPMVERQESGLWALPGRAPTGSGRGSHPADSLSPFELGRAPALAGVARERGAKLVSRVLGVPSFLGVALGLFATFAVFGTWALLHMQESQPSTSASESVPSELAPAPLVLDADQLPKPAKTAPPSESPPASGAEPVEVAAVSEPSESDAKGAAFAVPGASSTPCDDLVGELDVPRNIQTPQQRARLSNQHFRIAQKQLVTGHNDAAHESMCRAALLDATGPGSQLLAQHALGMRDYEKAARWMEKVVQARPDDVSVLELWGDILHQRGEVDKALEVWLRAYDVEREDDKKRLAVARRWVAQAATSLSGRDYPRAERTLRRALAFDPDSAAAARLLSVVFFRRGEEKMAHRWAEREKELVSASR